MENGSSRTPTHLWIVGILSLLWNCFGAFDYVMTQTRNDAWLSQFGEGVRAWIETFPAWVEFFWALGVWGALLGSILLLMRSKFAVHAFGASIVGMVVAHVWQYAAADMPAEMRTPFNFGMTAAIWVIAFALFFYALKMKGRGVLR